MTVVGVPELPAQAISIVAATPLNFLGNKMWASRARGLVVAFCGICGRPRRTPSVRAPRQREVRRRATLTAAPQVVRSPRATTEVRGGAWYHPALHLTGYTARAGALASDVVRGGDEVVQVHVDDRTGRSSSRGRATRSPGDGARLYEGRSGTKWELAAGLDPAGRPLPGAVRGHPARPLRLLHLDLLVLLGFGVSHCFFNSGRSGSPPRSRIPSSCT